MLKKTLAVLLTVSMLLGMAACNNGGTTSSSSQGSSSSAAGSSSSSSDAGSSAAGEAGKGSLTVWEGDPSRSVCGDAYVEFFKTKYPDLDFKFETKTEDTYQSTLASAFAAGQGPDVFWNWGTKNGILKSIVAENYVLPLDGKVDMSLFEKNGEKTMISGISYVDDKLYGVPTASIDTRTIYYNKDLFEEKGYKVSTKLSDFEAMCDQMLVDGIQPLTIAGKEFSSLFHVYDFILCASKGGPAFVNETQEGKVKMNDPRGVYALDKYMSWRDKGYFSTASTGNDASAAVLEFATGGTAMIICGSWLLSTVRDSNKDLNFGVYKLANEEDDKTYSCITANGCYSIAANTKNMDNAMMFVEWMATPEAQKTWMDAMSAIPGIPEVKAADETASEIGLADVQISGFYELLQSTAKDGHPDKVYEENWVKLFANQGITAQEFCDKVAEQQDAIK